ncbi:hypothetical protein CGCVW01_v013747 [Colletotrichum viniferum]|nr:hypothetical protein CGCVW01_v013747 [Colletotrichum viniferum]
MNIAWNAITKRDVDPNLGYEIGFYEQLEDCIDDIMTKAIRVVTNAGALNTTALFEKIKALCRKEGYPESVVAAVFGDDVSGLLEDISQDFRFPHLDHPEITLDDWGFKPYCGNAYIGCWGIVEALRAGARIVVAGRCADASPVMGAASWYYGWREDQYQELAGALLAAHLIECGPYVVGANFSGFKEFLPELVDLAFPIAEISRDGECVISRTAEGGSRTAEGGGHVTKHTVTAQLLYELQGHLYLNPDVVGDLSGAQVEEQTGFGEDGVRVWGAKGLPPPPTTKVMFAAEGGYQAEATFYINGLDVDEKVSMMKNQLTHMFKGSNFSRLSMEQYGTQVQNPSSQQAGAVQLRVFAQARTKDDIAAVKFKIPIYASAIDRRVLLGTGELIPVPSPKETADYKVVRPSADTAEPVDLTSLGPTEFVPLGSIVHARSGDKADNSNIGFFVRYEDEYAWLRSLLTVSRLKQLLGDDWYKINPNRRVERVEFPGINAVHFRILDNLNGGIASSDRIDGLGKGIAEYLPSRYVDIPKAFLQRGRI